jgi:hypothetical protein
VAAAFTQGCLTDALALTSDNAVWKRRERILQLLSEVATIPRSQSLRVAEALQKLGATTKSEKSQDQEEADDEDSSGSSSSESGGATEESSTPRAARAGMSDALKVVSAWLSDLLALHAGAGVALRNPDFSESLQSALPHYSPHQLYDALDYALKGDYYLQRNANPRLFCENLIFRICPTSFPTASARRRR